MSKTITQFQIGRCRIESGVFFTDDTAILLAGSPALGFVISERTSLVELDELAPAGWVEFEEIPLIASGAWALSTCLCVWEGEGGLALRSNRDGALQWLLHLETSEHFSAASSDGNRILAESGTYPEVWLWQIPLEAPWQLTVSRRQSAER